MQTRYESFIEATINTVVGYLVALLTQIIVYPLFDVELASSGHLAIAAIFSVVSILRSYALRRVFTNAPWKTHDLDS